MICPKCSHKNTPGAKFCSECGSPLTDSGKIEGLAGNNGLREDTEAQDGFATSKIPDIRIPGVNAYEDNEASVPCATNSEAEPFDFDPLADSDEEEPEYGDWGPYSYDPHPDGITKVIHDTRGIDEYLIESGYVAPASSWKSGGTMEMPKLDDEELPKQKDFIAPDANKRKGGKGKIVIACIVSLLVLAALGAGVSYGMELWGGKTIPDVSGMKKAEAVSALESLGFTVRTTDVKSDDIADTVLLMDPGAGERREEGTEIVLHVAIARTIPDVVGKNQEEVAKIFEEEGFENIEFVNTKSNEVEGSVLSVDPAAGTIAKSSQRITLTVAQAYTVPDVSGKGKDEAVSILNDEGYEASVIYVYSDIAAGTVTATNPKAGTKLESGATVEVQVAKSRGAEIISLTSDYLASAGTLSMGGTTYEIVSVDAAPTYEGGNTAKCAITVRAKTTLDGEVVYGSPKQRTVLIVWTDGNELESIS